MAVDYVDNGNDDGTCLGRAADKISFFAATPVVKQTGWAVPTDLTTVIAGNTAARLALVNYGLITTV